MFKLSAENLTGLGGPMGSETTWIEWSKYFNSLSNAMQYAENHYRRGPVPWVGNGKGRLRSKDLGFVMYHISTVEAED